MAIDKMDLSAHARFISSPGGPILEFDRLDEALSHAHRLTQMKRHPRAEVEVGEVRLGWTEIEALIVRFRIENREPLPTQPVMPRSSRK